MSNIQTASITPAILEALVRARDASYAPYSNFRVAAVAVSVDGRTFPACNVETAHSKSICAEASAISAMVGARQRELERFTVDELLPHAFGPHGFRNRASD